VQVTEYADESGAAQKAAGACKRPANGVRTPFPALSSTLLSTAAERDAKITQIEQLGAYFEHQSQLAALNKTLLPCRLNFHQLMPRG
jgi:hypothetical protein